MKLNIRELAGNARNHLKSTLLSVSENVWRTPLTRSQSFEILKDSVVYEQASEPILLPKLKDEAQGITLHESAVFTTQPDHIWELKKEGNVKSLRVCRSGGVLLNNKKLLNLDFGCTAGLLDSPVKSGSEKYPLVIAPWSHFWGAYYDYVFYVVAKLCRIEKVYGKQIWQEAMLCYPLLNTAFESEFLERLGIQKSNIIDTKHYWVNGIEAETVLVGNNQESWTPSLSDMRLLKERFCNDKPAVKNNRKLYIARAGRRKVINEAEVADVLRNHDFEIIEDVNRTLDEQIELFRSASVIVTPHGAALTNILWCDSGTTIIELFNQGYMPNYYYYMSKELGHPYHCLVAYDASKPQNHWSNTAEDIWVNIPDLTKKLEALFSQTKTATV